MKDVIFEMDLNGNWSYLNPAWEELTGLKVGDSLGEPHQAFLKDKNGKPLTTLIDLENPSCEPLRTNIKYLGAQGEIKWLDLSLKATKSHNGKPEGYIGTIVDISSLKKTEEALILAKEKETRANRAKDDFLSTMSHEIRTPLNAIIGISHLLLIEEPKKEQLENLNALRHSSEHLLSLLNDILDFNKIASGSLQLEEVDFSLEMIMTGLQSLFKNKAKEKNIAFVMKRDYSLPKVLIGDSTRISQILANLINNAIKFTDKGKVILDVEVALENEESCVLKFEVKDTGMGIPEDKYDRIFQSFAQANSDTTRKHGGTGLGLAICTQLLEVMESEIHLESKVDEGSSFSFFLNLKKSKSPNFSLDRTDSSDIANIGEQKKLKGVRMLIVEDNKTNIMVMRKLFSKWEIAFDIAENGLIGLEMATINSYEIILMDLQMPIMNGFEACRRIRQTENPLNKIVPIYALSASTGVDIKDEIEKFGMDGFISKPFDPFELYKTLCRVIHEERSL